MKKITTLTLIFALAFYSIAFAEQNKVTSNDSVDMISIKAEFIKFDNHWMRFRNEGNEHTDYETNRVDFQVIKPDKYAGMKISIGSFSEAELDSYGNFESKKSAYYSFDIPSNYFYDNFYGIDRKFIKNFKEIPK